MRESPEHSESHDFESYASLASAILAPEPVSSLDGYSGDTRRVAAGIAVYRNNVRAAFSRALGDEFPVVQKLVGEDFFKYLAHEYFCTEPPSSPLVSRYGDRLPQFLGTFEPAAHLPWLADVARLEALWLAAYHAGEAAALTPEEILARLGNDIGAARFRFHPSAQLFSSSWPAATVWHHNRAHENPPPLKLEAGGENVLLVRPEREVDVIAISEGTFHVLGMLREGMCVSAALEAGLEADQDLQPTECLQTLLSSAVIIGVR